MSWWRKSTEEELAVAGILMEVFAREAVVALSRRTSALPPTTALAAEFADRWQDFGLNKVKLAPTDSQRILTSAFGLAVTFPDKPLTVEAAIAAVKETDAQAPLVGRFEQDLNEIYGGSLQLPAAEEWLEQSLCRLANAGVVRDAIGLGARLQDAELDGQMRKVLRQSEQLAAVIMNRPLGSASPGVMSTKVKHAAAALDDAQERAVQARLRAADALDKMQPDPSTDEPSPVRALRGLRTSAARSDPSRQ